MTSCIRTYSIDHGLDQIPEVARRHGLKVMQGLWLSSLPDLSRHQIEGAVALAKRYPDVITAVIVGNEVLLRGEMSAPQLARTIREVKAQVTVPVTYADVWEFWLRYREVAAAVDFVTVHILPYWEDVPIPAANAAEHVDAIRQQVAAAFPDKEVLIGEFGWPSAGRMREGARPSPADQARVLHDVLALAKQQSYRVNVIEAYDQPWKRQLEGTVGGHWGLFDGSRRALKFEWGVAVSNHPHGAGRLRAVWFGGACFCRRLAAGARRPLALRSWLAISASAAASGTMIGWTIASIPLESLTVGDWMRSLAWGAVAIAAPVLCAMTVAAGVEVPSFARVVGRRADRVEGLACNFAWAGAGRAHVACSAGGAGARVRPALPRLPVPGTGRGRLTPSWCARRHGHGCGVCSPAPRPLRQRSWRCRRSTSCSMKRSPIGRRSGLPQAFWCWRSVCCRSGPRQTQNE